MRTVSFLDRNLSSVDASTADGVVHYGRLFDIAGDAETEVLILNDGDESLALGYPDVEIMEDIYVGDMIQFRASLDKVGNTSRTTSCSVYKLATPARRAGIDDALEGDMVWFEEPRLIATFECILVVKKELQRGIQPDGIVKNPWMEIDC